MLDFSNFVDDYAIFSYYIIKDKNALYITQSTLSKIVNYLNDIKAKVNEYMVEYEDEEISNSYLTCLNNVLDREIEYQSNRILKFETSSQKILKVFNSHFKIKRVIKYKTYAFLNEAIDYGFTISNQKIDLFSHRDHFRQFILSKSFVHLDLKVMSINKNDIDTVNQELINMYISNPSNDDEEDVRIYAIEDDDDDDTEQNEYRYNEEDGTDSNDFIQADEEITILELSSSDDSDNSDSSDDSDDSDSDYVDSDNSDDSDDEEDIIEYNNVSYTINNINNNNLNRDNGSSNIHDGHISMYEY